MGTLLNWIDTMFFGVRRLFDGSDAELPERPAVKFAGACSVVDDPAGNRTVITVGGLIPDKDGGFTIGTTGGGWVTVKSPSNGFRVYNDDESAFAFEVDNSYGVTRSLWTIEARGGVLLDDAQGVQPAPASGAYLYALAGRSASPSMCRPWSPDRGAGTRRSRRCSVCSRTPGSSSTRPRRSGSRRPSPRRRSTPLPVRWLLCDAGCDG